MGTAVSIVILFTVTSTIVRVAGVLLEHTGIPRHIARLQAMSALSGTGFTTSESELLLQTPERRRILVLLIATGSVGIASVVATIVVSAFGIHDTVNGIMIQGAAIVAAIVFVRYVLLSRSMDDLVCGMAHAWMKKRMVPPRYDILCQIDSVTVLAAHPVSQTPPSDISEWPVKDLIVVGVRAQDSAGPMQPWTGETLSQRTHLVLAGPIRSHDAFSEAYGAKGKTGTHVEA